jgi:RNA polymerase sigma-70 factor (ECF subfamily)
MYRIALNTAITHFKKVKRMPSHPLSLDGIEIPDIRDQDETEEQLQQLSLAIEQLDKIEKSIVLLYLEKKSYEEISEITGLSKSNVGVKLNRVKAKLASTLTR